MSLSHVTKEEIMAEVELLPPETLLELRDFIAFLRFRLVRGGPEEHLSVTSRRWQAALDATFGLWVERDDVASDGVAYVQAIRRGHRLSDWLEPVDEAD